MKYLNLIVILFIAACTGRSEDMQIHDYVVETLFTHDGCTVYRFRDDDGHRIYFTNCHGETSWRQSTGKSSRAVSVRGE